MNERTDEYWKIRISASGYETKKLYVNLSYIGSAMIEPFVFSKSKVSICLQLIIVVREVLIDGN